MALTHGPIRDTDPHFIIDPITRKLSTESTKITLVQGDHNSERFTFEIPQTVEGHKMGESDKIEIHYINVDQMTKEQSPGMWEADDVNIEPAEGEKPARVTFSWLIEDKATKYQGVLNFVVRFVCYDGERVKYAWHTAIHNGIQIAGVIKGGEMAVSEYIDILRKWEHDLKANQVVSLEQTQASTESEGENVWTATFGDGRTSELRVKNGAKGDTGLVGAIETIQGDRLDFFVGNKAQYDEVKQKAGLFAIITDENDPETLGLKIAAVAEAVAKLSKSVDTLNAKVDAIHTASRGPYVIDGQEGEVEIYEMGPGVYAISLALADINDGEVASVTDTAHTCMLRVDPACDRAESTLILDALGSEHLFLIYRCFPDEPDRNPVLQLWKQEGTDRSKVYTSVSHWVVFVQKIG